MKERGEKMWAPWAGRWTPVFVFVAALSVLRLVYLWLSPLTLVEDEAHYWEWSRQIDWSYYSKGPGVAWVIGLSTALFGDVEWAVRLPSVVASAVGSLASAVTARTVFEDRRSGFVAAVLYQCVPPFAVIGFLMTIDGPFLAAWAAACAAAVLAATTGRRRWLVATALALAIGFIFKYTIVLLAAGLVVAAVAGRRPARFGPGAWLAAAGVFGIGLVPVLLWNATRDWVTVRHLIGHLGLPGGDIPATHAGGGWDYQPRWTLEYLAMLLMVGPVGVVGACAARKRWANPGVRVLVLASAPVLVFYLLVTVVAQAEGNWALGAFVGLVPLAAGVIPGALDRGYVPLRAGWRLSLLAGVLGLAALPLTPVLDRLPNMGRVIPGHRVMGMREVAAAAEEHLAGLRARTGLEPFLITSHYGRASLLAFYVEGRPVVYSAGSFTYGGRRSQYDLWRVTDLRNPETVGRLAGRPALIFGGDRELWTQAFATVEAIEPLAGEPDPDLLMFIGYSFKGFADRP